MLGLILDAPDNGRIRLGPAIPVKPQQVDGPDDLAEWQREVVSQHNFESMTDWQTAAVLIMHGPVSDQPEINTLDNGQLLGQSGTQVKLERVLTTVTTWRAVNHDTFQR